VPVVERMDCCFLFPSSIRSANPFVVSAVVFVAACLGCTMRLVRIMDVAVFFAILDKICLSAWAVVRVEVAFSKDPSVSWEVGYFGPNYFDCCTIVVEVASSFLHWMLTLYPNLRPNSNRVILVTSININ